MRRRVHYISPGQLKPLCGKADPIKTTTEQSKTTCGDCRSILSRS